MKTNGIWPFKVPVPKMAHCADNGSIKVDADFFSPIFNDDPPSGKRLVTISISGCFRA